MNDFFSNTLLNWYEPSDRPMPWKGIKNPYFIWLSEIILQQTRVQQGMAYYNKFTTNYPTVQHLASAPIDQVLKDWEGLGYYTRARNLHACAKAIVNQHNGSLPNTMTGLLSLPGIGPYTAAAIGSFAFQLPVALVDGNVYRVLTRFFDIDTCLSTAKAKKQIQTLAQELLQEPSSTYNQAIMDFGATVCKPALPLCHECPMQRNCLAYKNGTVAERPVKKRKKPIKHRHFIRFVIHSHDHIIIKQRTSNDIWEGLYDFPELELGKESINNTDLITSFLQKLGLNSPDLKQKKSTEYHQKLSHQKISTFFVEVFYEGDLQSLLLEQKDKIVLTNKKNLLTFAFPKIIGEYLKEASVDLNVEQSRDNNN